jgi:NAD(P)-dependent dehydrogenase (short-subunit alcohol dehydrogenase family)
MICLGMCSSLHRPAPRRIGVGHGDWKIRGQHGWPSASSFRLAAAEQTFVEPEADEAGDHAGPKSLAVTGQLADGWIPPGGADWLSQSYSNASRLEAPGFYGATKAAVNAITASLRQELQNDTIRVVTVIPGATATNLARHQPDLLRGLAASFGEEIGPLSGGLFPQDALDRAAAAAGPVLASADDVARAVLFAITQPIELSISEIAVQPARRPGVPA